MKYPHPWLARMARAGMLAAVAAFMMIATATLLPPGASWNWYGGRQLFIWQAATTPGQMWGVVSDQGQDLSTLFVGPAGWLLAAGLLRLAATGRLRVAGWRLPVGRWVPTGGMAAGLLTVGFGAVRWEAPQSYFGPAESRAIGRIRQAVEAGQMAHFSAEQPPGENDRSMSFTYWPPNGSPETARQVVVGVCREGYLLFACVRGGGLLFFLSATVYCLAGRHSSANT